MSHSSSISRQNQPLDFEGSDNEAEQGEGSENNSNNSQIVDYNIQNLFLWVKLLKKNLNVAEKQAMLSEDYTGYNPNNPGDNASVSVTAEQVVALKALTKQLFPVLTKLAYNLIEPYLNPSDSPNSPGNTVSSTEILAFLTNMIALVPRDHGSDSSSSSSSNPNASNNHIDSVALINFRAFLTETTRSLTRQLAKRSKMGPENKNRDDNAEILIGSVLETVSGGHGSEGPESVEELSMVAKEVISTFGGQSRIMEGK